MILRREPKSAGSDIWSSIPGMGLRLGYERGHGRGRRGRCDSSRHGSNRRCCDRAGGGHELRVSVHGLSEHGHRGFGQGFGWCGFTHRSCLRLHNACVAQCYGAMLMLCKDAVVTGRNCATLSLWHSPGEALMISSATRVISTQAMGCESIARHPSSCAT